MTPCLRWAPMLLALVSALATIPVHADDAAEAWTLGREAFAAGDYAVALAHFERTRDAGQEGPAVHYNIAVCQYRIADYAAARRTFAALGERFPAMRSLAEYNLGLVALKLDEPDAAERHFRESRSLTADDPKLRALASAQLDRLAGDAGEPVAWLGTFSARAGYDDNVILRDESGLASDVSAESPFVEAYGTLRGPYPGWNGVRLDGGFFAVRYPDVDDFNQASLYAGALYEWQRGDFGVDLGAHLGATTLGGDGFDRSARLTARVTRRLDAASTIAARFRYDDIAAIDDIFDGIEGSRQRIDVTYRRYRNGHYLMAGITRETNDRANPGVSPDKTKLEVGYRYAPDVGWGYGVGAEFRMSDYGGIDPAREEDLVQFDVRLTRHSRSGWQFFAGYLRADNDSTDPAFSYGRNQLSLGAYRVF